jgi:hypothetical protein
VDKFRLGFSMLAEFGVKGEWQEKNKLDTPL